MMCLFTCPGALVRKTATANGRALIKLPKCLSEIFDSKRVNISAQYNLQSGVYLMSLTLALRVDQRNIDVDLLVAIT